MNEIPPKEYLKSKWRLKEGKDDLQELEGRRRQEATVRGRVPADAKVGTCWLEQETCPRGPHGRGTGSEVWNEAEPLQAAGSRKRSPESAF